MRSNVRRSVEAVIRVRDFLHANPLSDPSHLTLTTRFDELVAKVQSLAVIEQGGRLDARAANRHRKGLRHDIQARLVRYVERFGVLAAAEQPDLAGRFRGPAFNAGNSAFLTRGWDLVNLARANQNLLARHGLPASELDALGTALTRYEEATLKSNVGRQTHAGARREIESIHRELGKILGVLDVINQTRFRDDEQRLGQWLSARNVVGPFKPTSPAPAPSPDQPAPGAGESRSA
jgi:hypothetical protein